MAKITTSTLLNMKKQGKKISTITAYDASFAKLFDQAGIHAILIGDSLGMVFKAKMIRFRLISNTWLITLNV
jgi:3-methyl-2-oxobutanoate hydroxymethyltransferase